MQIPSYQINNILKVYTRQLSQSKLIDRQKEFAQASSPDNIEISSEGKRQTVIEQVSADIINNEKVTQTLSVEDSDFLIKRLEELVKAAVDKNMES